MSGQSRDSPREGAPSEIGPVIAVITVVASVASAAFMLSAGSFWHVVSGQPTAFASFLLISLGLQLLSVQVYGRGSVSVSGLGILGAGFVLGAAPAMVIAAATPIVHAVARRHGRVHRVIFNVATLAIAAGAAAEVFRGVSSLPFVAVGKLLPAVAAGATYWVVNIGLLTLVMSLAEQARFLAIWRERFRWLTIHYLLFGPLALASATAYDRVGVDGLLVFAIPPALVFFATKQYVDRTSASVEEVRRANAELQRANAELETRNADLRELFEFAGGLAAQAHDRNGLVAYAETALQRLTGAPARITVGLGEAGGDVLAAGGHPLGSVHVHGEPERWERLREALLPQLSTALESAELVERIRKTHLETIAALSRSMEAKDYYTGGHTERVATVAVAVARRLGFEGHDLDAIEIGALLHDIGKIGIPERILHKPGPLDDDEWKVMKEHPVISEYILSEVDLPPIVLEIARSSHERMDGAGYPDGLAGEEIPLAARIVLVADAFDALTSDRPYRRGRRVRDALEELRAHAGTQFCPTVIDALDRVYREEPHVLAGGELRAISVA